MTHSQKSGVVVEQEDFVALNIPLHDLELPTRGEVHLWFLDLRCLAGPLNDALGSGEGASASLTVAQLLFARRFYLRLLLGAYLGLPGKSVKINRKNRGKPVLDPAIHDAELHFSMAKSEDKLLIGFSTTSHIGVDLEPATRRARDAMGVATRYFSPAEAESLSRVAKADLDATFLRVWACKEAVVKASGYGIANQFDRFTVDTDTKHPVAVLDFEGNGPGDWSLALVKPGNDFLGAVATEGGISTLQAFHLLPVSKSP